MAKTLNIVTNSKKGGLPVANQGLKLSKILAIEKIEEHEQFKELYSIDEDLLERIAEDMKANKFDASQPVHIWHFKDEDGTEHFYLIDGYTRVKAAKLAGLETVPYFEHTFESFEEAHRYALHLQVDRRNLNGMDLLHNIEALMGSEYIQNMKGNKNAAMGEMLGVSEKTIERAKFVEKNASEEQIEAIEAGEATVNSTYDEIKAEKKKSKAKEKTEEDDEISDALDDSDGNPKGIVISDHSDHIERPDNKLSPEVDNERTAERRNAYEMGFVEGFEQAANYVLMCIMHGVSEKYIYKEIFCNKVKHNYESFKHHIGNDSSMDYEYNGFRKELIENSTNKLTDLNSLPIKDYSQNPDDDYDGENLPFEDSEENNEKINSAAESSGEAFDIGFADEDK